MQGHCRRGRQPEWVRSSITVPGEQRGGEGHKWSEEAGLRRWKHSDQMGAKAQIGGGPQGPGGPALGAEAAVDAVVLAELGALRVGAGVRAG